MTDLGVEGPLPRLILVREIVEAVAEKSGVTVEDIHSGCRKRKFARPRQYAMVLALELTVRSYGDIGNRIGGRDHTTVFHAEKWIAALEEDDPDIRNDLQILRTQLDPDGSQAAAVKPRREKARRLFGRRVAAP